MSTAEALSELGNERIRQGGNLSPFEAISLHIDDLYEEARNWADGEPIDSEEKHDAATVVYDLLHEAGKRAEALRVEEVRPLDEAKAAIQNRYHPLIGDTKSAGKGKVPLGKAVLSDLLVAWRQKEAARKAEEDAERQRKVEAEKQAAIEKVRASSGNLEAREQAEADLRAAKDDEREAARFHREATTGLGLRSRKVPVLTGINAAVRHYWKANPQAFEDLVLELAAADLRAGKGEIPGIEIHIEQKAV